LPLSHAHAQAGVRRKWNAMHDLGRILSAAAQLETESAALATIVRTTGSTYRRPGARMLITTGGEMIGAVSGGCLEEQVAHVAQEVLATGEAVLLRFDTTLLFGCHGLVEILVERLDRAGVDILGAVARRWTARQPCVIAVVFAASDNVGPHLGSYFVSKETASSLPWEAQRDALAVLEGGRSAQHAYPWGECFFEIVQPAIRLVIVGGGYDVLPLARLGRSLGWDVQMVVHPAEAVPAAEDRRLVASPADLAARLRPDPLTAVVLMEHHFGRDLAYLDALVSLPLPYLGLLGPRRRREQLLAALFESGHAPDAGALTKLRSPVGLDLGAETPEEIALSIAAEIRAALAQRSARPLRECRGPIHPPLDSATKAAPCAR
jgi:xanthine/CO dehydrogenase XdhC/CoxF family maturation factor